MTQNHAKPTPPRCIGRSARHGEHTKATSALFTRPMTPNRAGGRFDLTTPKQSPVGRSYSLMEELSSSVECGAGPSSIRGGSSGTTRRVGFDIEDVGSDASGSKPRRGDGPMIEYEATQTRLANRNKEREKCAACSKPVKGSNKKRLKKTKEAKELQ